MLATHTRPTRRTFLAASAASVGALATGLPVYAQATPPYATSSQAAAQAAAPTTSPAAKPARPTLPVVPAYDRETINLIGPKAGYSPMIGVLVSQLSWMETALLGPTRKLTVPDLDFLLDAHANTIGALMLHTVAAEVFYQRNTFDGDPWGKFPKELQDKWDAPMELGDKGRATVKGHDWNYYVEAYRAVRQHTLDELSKRDDAWLLTADKDWPWGPTNNFCKWFHVTEHISHHAGQIDLILSRLPGHAPVSSS